AAPRTPGPPPAVRRVRCGEPLPLVAAVPGARSAFAAHPSCQCRRESDSVMGIANSMDSATPKILLESFQNLMVAIGRSQVRDDATFPELRAAVLGIQELRPHLPAFVTTCRTSAQFWAFIKGKAAHYYQRDAIVWEGFAPAFGYLEAQAGSPSAAAITEVLKAFDADHVNAAWQKALARKTSDPEAALTSARALLESTCKHIL